MKCELRKYRYFVNYACYFYSKIDWNDLIKYVHQLVEYYFYYLRVIIFNSYKFQWH